jgi:hypothetical protein
MSNIIQDNVLNMINLAEESGEIQLLVRKIILIRYRLGHAEDLDWYARKGISNQEENLVASKQRYDELRKEYNSITNDELINTKQKIQTELDEFMATDSGGSRFFRGLAIQGKKAGIAKCDYYLQMKSGFGELPELEELLEDNKLLEKLFGV